VVTGKQSEKVFTLKQVVTGKQSEKVFTLKQVGIEISEKIFTHNYMVIVRNQKKNSRVRSSYNKKFKKLFTP